MPSTADALLNELIESADNLIKLGEHEGDCTNALQKSIASSIPECKKHQAALADRLSKFRQAVEQLRLMRDVFGSSTDGMYLQQQ